MILHMSKIAEKTTTASAGIARYLAERLQMPLVDGPGAEKSDTVIIVNSPTAFCNWLDEVVQLALGAKRLIWVMNDYTLYPPTQLRDALDMRKMELWSTVPKLAQGLADRWTYRNLPQIADRYVNWNRLTYHPQQVARDLEGVVYWGALRERRTKALEELLDTNKFPVTISTSTRGAEKFGDLLPHAKIIEPQVPLIPWAGRFQATVYIEDDTSHIMYSSPANRFYEAASTNLPMFVDVMAVKTFRDAGIKIADEMIVHSACDIEARLSTVQSQIFHLTEDELDTQLKGAL